MKKAFEIYLYSNVHISLCAAVFCLQYLHLSNQDHRQFWLFGVLLFGSSLCLYCTHRYIGYQKLKKKDSVTGRYVSIEKLLPLYPYLFGIGLVISIFCIVQLGLEILIPLSVPAILSMLYVIPIFPQNKRLRDLPYIKIFILALCWTWFAIWYLFPLDLSTLIYLAIESFCFVFAITLPFDLRDRSIDSGDNVITLANSNSTPSIKRLIIGLFLVCIVILVLLYGNALLPVTYVILTTALYLLLLRILIYEKDFDNDFLLTGFVDGSLMIKGLLGLILLI